MVGTRRAVRGRGSLWGRPRSIHARRAGVRNKRIRIRRRWWHVGPQGNPAAAWGWGIVVVAMQQQYAGHAAQVLALAAQCPAAAYYTKWIIAVDEDIDPTDFNEVMWALSTRCHPAEDIDVLRNTWSTGLDPSQYIAEQRPYGSKWLINACKPHRYIKQFPPSTLLRRDVYERVTARWAELGFTEPPPKLNVFHPG